MSEWAGIHGNALGKAPAVCSSTFDDAYLCNFELPVQLSLVSSQATSFRRGNSLGFSQRCRCSLCCLTSRLQLRLRICLGGFQQGLPLNSSRL
jgi:hypothetical protein